MKEYTVTRVIVRQGIEVTLPDDIVEAAGISEGTIIDVTYVNGVVTLRPRLHDEVETDPSAME